MINSMNQNNFRLKWKIFLFLLGFCALLLVILWLMQTVFLDSFYKNIKMMEIKREAGLITEMYGNEDMAENIASISQNSNISVSITDLNGSNLLNPDEYQDEHSIYENSGLISHALSGGGEYYEYTESPAPPPAPIGGSIRGPGRPLQAQSLVYVKITDNEPERQLAVMINAVITPVSATVTTLRYQLYAVSGIMLILSIVLAIIIAKRISRPIEEINYGAQTLAKGNYDTRFNGKGFYEIVTLSETLNKAAADLGKVDVLRRELLANISHDLRTPLALIYSYAEMMHVFPEEITSDQTKVIMDETKWLSSLVSDVLDISKLESDMEQLNISRFNLTQMILNTTRRTEAFLKNEGLKIVFSYDGEVFANADEKKIDRVFYNLLANAVNYSGGYGEVSVTQKIIGDSVRISVTDNGEGIAENELPYIWDRYYKSGKEHQRAVMGTGLGLTIVKKIIELHGGTYGVISEIGKGSTFWFEIKI